MFTYITNEWLLIPAIGGLVFALLGITFAITSIKKTERFHIYYGLFYLFSGLFITFIIYKLFY